MTRVSIFSWHFESSVSIRWSILRLRWYEHHGSRRVNGLILMSFRWFADHAFWLGYYQGAESPSGCCRDAISYAGIEAICLRHQIEIMLYTKLKAYFRYIVPIISVRPWAIWSCGLDLRYSHDCATTGTVISMAVKERIYDCLVESKWILIVWTCQYQHQRKVTKSRSATSTDC